NSHATSQSKNRQDVAAAKVLSTCTRFLRADRSSRAGRGASSIGANFEEAPKFDLSLYHWLNGSSSHPCAKKLPV
ncbi:hypothetical protein, partial [Mesorhizobium sp. M7A.F.Ca.CA.001.09.2.1]